MSGFPNTPSRSDFGPTMVNKRVITDPSTQLSAEMMNLLLWQVAGCGRTAPKALIVFDPEADEGEEITVQQLAFDPDGLLPRLTYERIGQGEYRITFASTYTDQRGAAIAYAPSFALSKVNYPGGGSIDSNAVCAGQTVTVIVPYTEEPVEYPISLQVW